MQRTSSTRLTTVNPLSITPLASPDDTQPSRGELRSQLQDCAHRKDWSALQNILAAYPDTCQTKGPGKAHPVLELDLADTRELGDLAEQLPPEAHLPVFVVRGADLRAPDQRIAQLTAHRHSFGLRLENCQIDQPCMDVLTQGAQQAHAAGHPGLRVLGCTHAQAVTADTLFSGALDDDERDIHRSKCGLLDIGIQDLIQASPHLESFALTGLVPIESMPGENGQQHTHGVIDLQPVFGALARTPLRQLHLDNCCSFNLNQNVGVDEDWSTWADSTSVSIQHIQLTRWCLDKEYGDGEARLRYLLGGKGISRPVHGAIHVECADVVQAAHASWALGQALRRRNAEVHVQWECRVNPDPDIRILGEEIHKDESWCAFYSTLLGTDLPKLVDVFRAPLAIKLIRPQMIDLIRMTDVLKWFKNIRALTVANNGRTNWIEAEGPELVQDRESRLVQQMQYREHRVVELLKSLEGQPQLIELDLGHLLDNLAQERLLAAATITEPQSHPPLGKYSDQRLQKYYQGLKTQIEREARRDRIAAEMTAHGLDLGGDSLLIADVASVIARQLQGARGELGESLLSVALTNTTNYAAWEAAASDKV